MTTYSCATDLPNTFDFPWFCESSAYRLCTNIMCIDLSCQVLPNSLRPRRNRRYNADDIFKCIFLKENVWIPTKMSLKFVPKGPVNNVPAFVQIMAWCRLDDKPLSGPMMVSRIDSNCEAQGSITQSFNYVARLTGRESLWAKRIYVQDLF